MRIINYAYGWGPKDTGFITVSLENGRTVPFHEITDRMIFLMWATALNSGHARLLDGRVIVADSRAERAATGGENPFPW